MKTFSRQSQFFSLLVLFVVCATILAMHGCTFLRASRAAIESTDHFLVNENDARVLYEKGAEENAEVVAEMLPASIAQVEEVGISLFITPGSPLFSYQVSGYAHNEHCYDYPHHQKGRAATLGQIKKA